MKRKSNWSLGERRHEESMMTYEMYHLRRPPCAPGALVIARSPELECVSAARCQSTLLGGDGKRRTR